MQRKLPKVPISREQYLEMMKRAIAANLAARIEHDRRQEEAYARHCVEHGDGGELEIICVADLLAAGYD